MFKVREVKYEDVTVFEIYSDKAEDNSYSSKEAAQKEADYLNKWGESK
jgi:hypothetical protein